MTNLAQFKQKKGFVSPSKVSTYTATNKKKPIHDQFNIYSIMLSHFRAHYPYRRGLRSHDHDAFPSERKLVLEAYKLYKAQGLVHLVQIRGNHLMSSRIILQHL